MAIERTLVPAKDGKYRAIYVQVEDELHPAAVREQVDKQMRERIERFLESDDLFMVILRHCRQLELELVKLGGTIPANLSDALQNKLQRLRELRDKRDELVGRVLAKTPDELKDIDIRSDAEWRKPPKQVEEVKPG